MSSVLVLVPCASPSPPPAGPWGLARPQHPACTLGCLSLAEDEWQVRFDCAQTEIVFLRKRLAQLEERLEAELGTRTGLEQKASAASPGGDRDTQWSRAVPRIFLSLLPGALHLLLAASPTDQGKPDIFYSGLSFKNHFLCSKIPPWSSVSVDRG